MCGWVLVWLFLVGVWLFLVFFAINCIKGRKGTVLGPTSSGPYRPLSDVINDVCRHAGTDLASCYGRISTGVLCSFLPSVG